MNSYSVNEIFWSLQGEGMRCGEMSVFIRMSGCNMKCRMEKANDSPGGFDCDTEFVSGRKLTDSEILTLAIQSTKMSSEWIEQNRPWIVFTGGEPALQLDRHLVSLCQQAGFRCAIETNGSINVDELELDWVTVSPKVAEHAVRQTTADEVKYVRSWGQWIPRPACTANHKLLSPSFVGNQLDEDSLTWCLLLIELNPEWRLSVQQHKSWRVR